MTTYNWIEEEEQDSDDPNVRYVHLHDHEVWSADCPSCLNRRPHSDNEHYADLNRIQESSQ